MPSELEASCCIDQEEVVGELSGVFLYKNGKVVRQPTSLYPNVPPNASFVDGVATKDVLLSVEDHTWARIYLPQINSEDMADAKKPILVFFHGGGFVIFSAATGIFDSACRKCAVEMGVMVISVGYRLAPEHRLPAAFDDACFALRWLQEQASMTPKAADPWLALHGDFSSCFLMGISSGASIVHHLALTVFSTSTSHLLSRSSPMQIRGLILVVPFFGGILRTSSELTYAHNDILTLHDSDAAWSLSLPLGATRDHPYCNPLGPCSPDLRKICDLPPYLMIIGGKDPLHDRQMAFVDAMRKSDKDVEVVRYENCGHCTPFAETDLMLFMERCLKQKAAATGVIVSCSEETFDTKG